MPSLLRETRPAEFQPLLRAERAAAGSARRAQFSGDRGKNMLSGLIFSLSIACTGALLVYGFLRRAKQHRDLAKIRRRIWGI